MPVKLKRVFFLLISMSFFHMNFGQSTFEGQIIYRLRTTDSTIVVRIDTWFGKKKIKFITNVEKAPAAADIKSETIILDFDNSCIDRLKDADKKIERESMLGSGKKQDIPNLKPDSTFRTIIGLQCIGYTTGRIDKDEMKDSVIQKTEAEIKFWYADSLFFPVPDSLKMIQMVPLFTNGRIALGSNIFASGGGITFNLWTEAVKINRGRRYAPPALFKYPRDYTLIHKQ